MINWSVLTPAVRLCLSGVLGTPLHPTFMGITDKGVGAIEAYITISYSEPNTPFVVGS